MRLRQPLLRWTSWPSLSRRERAGVRGFSQGLGPRVISREGYYVTLARLHHACDQIVYELESWPGVQIERQSLSAHG